MRSRLAILTILAALGTLFAIPSSAQAGNCGYVTHSYYTPQYVQPAVIIDPNQYVNVVAKAFLVQANPYYPGQVLAPLQSYTSVGDDVRSYYSQKDAIKQGFKEALLELQQSQQQGNSNLQPGAGQGATPQQPNALAPAGAKPWQSVAVNMMKTNCITCHNPQSHPERLDLTGNLDLNSFDNRFYDSVKDQRADMWLRVTALEQSKEFMPKGGERIKPEEMEAVWTATSVATQEAKLARRKIPASPVPNPPVVPKSPPVAGPADKK